MDAFTVTTRRDFCFAEALADSYRRHHAEGNFTIFVLDRLLLPTAARQDVQVRAVAEVVGDELDLLGAMYPSEVLDSVVLGGILQALLSDAQTPLLYLGPTMHVEGPLEDLVRAVEQHEVVLVPNAFAPLPPDDLEPSQVEVLELGAFSTQLLAMRSGTSSAALLGAWPKRLDYQPKDSPRETFQRWFDSIPATLAGIGIMHGKRGYNAAYWNLAGCRIERSDGELLIDGSPLRVMNLTDFDPARPELLAPDQQRVRLSYSPELRDLCATYSKQLMDLGWKAETNHIASYSELPDGSELTPVMRSLFRRGLREGDLQRAPFDDRGLREFRDYLNAPAKRGRVEGLTRLHEAIWDSRIDLRAAYPHLDGPDGAGYAGWLWVYGPEQEGVVAQLLPPAPAHIEPGSQEEANAARAPWGVNVAGFFTSELGLGEAARLLLAGLDARNIPALPIQGRLLPPARQGAEFAYVAPTNVPYLINIICMNGDTIPPFAREAGPRFFEGRYTIALWWWEVGDFPEGWHDAFEFIDEVWVASDHIREAIAPESPVPVVKVALPVTMPRIVPHERARLGLPEDGFLFLYMYDYHSTLARKNPLGTIEAYKRAFGPDSGTRLVLKCINAENLPDDHERVLVAVGDRPDITIIDRYVSAEEKNALIDACDCYVSLHRSEGFGLTPAEAMLLHKPVIATRYGGTLEFMTDDNAYLVDWSPVEVGPHAHPYPPQARWADPDLAQAAQLMRHVFEHPEEARARAQAGAKDVRRLHSPAVAGEQMQRRLRVIYERMRESASSSPPALASGLSSDFIDAPPAAPGGRLGRAKRIARSITARLLEPWLYRQRRIDRELLDAVTRLTATQNAHLAETLSAFRKDRTQLADLGRGLRAAEQRLNELDRRTEHHLAQHEAVPYMADETAFARWEEPLLGTVSGFVRTNADLNGDAVYRNFENAFRGPEQRVRDIQRRYLPLLEEGGPVLDIGCGRGELLDLLRERGIPATGVDLDEGMVDHARAKGHQVTLGDGNEELQRHEDGSLGAVVAIELIEHLPFDELLQLLRLARVKLRPQGKLILETVNPHAVHAMKTFWVDPTHQHPIFPEVALELCRSAGFSRAFCFHPTGSGDVDLDRDREPIYAVVAYSPETAHTGGSSTAAADQHAASVTSAR